MISFESEARPNSELNQLLSPPQNIVFVSLYFTESHLPVSILNPAPGLKAKIVNSLGSSDCSVEAQRVHHLVREKNQS